MVFNFIGEGIDSVSLNPTCSTAIKDSNGDLFFIM